MVMKCDKMPRMPCGIANAVAALATFVVAMSMFVVASEIQADQFLNSEGALADAS